MSVRVMTAVFDRYPNGGGEMLLALSLADHADDNGRGIKTSVQALAKKTRQSVRSVKYQLKQMRSFGWLVQVGAGIGGGRGSVKEYEIASSWVTGVWVTYPQPASKKFKKSVIPRRLAKSVFERDAYRCKHCDGHIDLACDHIIPESKGGLTVFENLQTLCRPCNSRKGTKS